MKELINLPVGAQYGELTILENNVSIVVGKYSKRFVKAKCICGNVVLKRLHHVYTGAVKSCGCWGKEQRRAASTKHGMRGTRIYRIWQQMKKRATSKTCKEATNYSLRGISISKEWLDFNNFYQDMKGSYRDDLTIERTNNELGYSKENCKWATYTEQANNTRRNKNYSLKYPDAQPYLKVKKSWDRKNIPAIVKKIMRKKSLAFISLKEFAVLNAITSECKKNGLLLNENNPHRKIMERLRYSRDFNFVKYTSILGRGKGFNRCTILELKEITNTQ